MRGKKPEQEERDLIHEAWGNRKARVARGKGCRKVARGKVRHCVRQGKAKKSKARQGVSAERICDYLDYERQGNAMQSKARQGEGRVKATQ